MKEQQLAWLIDFMTLKSKLLMEASGTDSSIFTTEDLIDLTSWSDDVIEKCYTSIRKELTAKSQKDSRDDDYCPWCIKSPEHCEECSFGKRHGKCNDDESLYRELFCKLPIIFSTVIWDNIEEFRSLKPAIVVKPKLDVSVGSEVWDVRFGKGKVSRIREGGLYTIEVIFESRGGGVYTSEGKYNINDLFSCLFLSEPKPKPVELKMENGSILHFCLKRIDQGGITLTVCDSIGKCRLAGSILSIHSDGSLQLYDSINKGLGLQLDPQGRIKK